MQTESLADTARKYFNAYVEKDKRFIESHLAEDFTFTSPMDNHIDAKEYFKRCWPNSETTKSFTFIDIIEKDNEAIVVYELHTTDGKIIRNTELMKFEDDKLKSTEVFFGREVDQTAGLLI